MSKRGIIGRVTQLSRADVNAVIDSAADQRNVLDQLVRDYAATIAEAEHAIAQLVGNLGIAELDQEEDAEAVAAWSREAEATSQTADELRAVGDAVDADRFDDLARIALERQLIIENDIKTVQHTIAAQTESIETLANGLDQMRLKLSELTHKRDRSMDRPASAQAQPRRVDILDPAGEVARFEQLVRREDDRARGSAKGREASALDAQFAELGHLDGAAEIEERLKALKTGRAMAAAMARAHHQPLR
jgi:phage shock protein A